MSERVPDDERERLVERIITAEQDERRRLALFLHDGPVQNLAGIALMLDAAVQAIDDGRPEAARGIMASALERHRETIRSLRDLSFNIEPVVLRDQGFGAAVDELANQLGMEHRVQIEVDVDAGGAARREGAGRALPDRPRVAEPGGPARAARRRSRSRPETAGGGSRRSSRTTARASGGRRRSTRSRSAHRP